MLKYSEFISFWDVRPLSTVFFHQETYHMSWHIMIGAPWCNIHRHYPWRGLCILQAETDMSMKPRYENSASYFLYSRWVSSQNSKALTFSVEKSIRSEIPFLSSYRERRRLLLSFFFSLSLLRGGWTSLCIFEWDVKWMRGYEWELGMGPNGFPFFSWQRK